MKRKLINTLAFLLITANIYAVDLESERVSMEFNDVDIQTVLQIFVKEKGLNVVAGDDVTGKITVSLNNVSLKKALDVILEVNGFDYTIEDDIVKVFKRGSEKLRTEIIQLNKITAEQAKNLVSGLLSGEGKLNADAGSGSLVVMDKAEIIQQIRTVISGIEEKTLPQKEGEKSLDSGKKLKVLTLKNARASDITGLVSPLLSKEGEIIRDDKSNTLIVTDVEPQLGTVLEAINFFDRKPRQVMIEAKIMEVALRDSDTMGMDWFWHTLMKGVYDATGKAQDLFSLGVKVPSDYDSMGSTGAGFKYGTLDSKRFSIALKALQEKSNAKLLSAPKVATLNNCSAEIEIVDKWPKKSNQVTESAGGTKDTTTYDFVDVPIKLTAVPVIGEDGFIDMSINIQVDNVVEIVDAATNTPRISSRKTNTMLRIRNGETIAIGGLIKQDIIQKETKVPVLGDIPVLKTMFRTKKHDTIKSELIIFITPAVMESGEPDAELKAELQKKLEAKIIEDAKKQDQTIPAVEEEKKPAAGILRKPEIQQLLDEMKSLVN